ncbi:hypothetical protein ACP4OV_014925 [Aristida adscensionis]
MVLESEVHVLESSFVVPSEATPVKELWLSPLDMVAASRHTPVLFFYGADAAAAADFLAVARLKEALAKTLVALYPLAGRLGVDGDGRVMVSCNDEGALFVVARSSLTADYFDNFKPSQEQRQLFLPRVEPSSLIMAIQARLMFPANIRRRVPHLPGRYFGNAVVELRATAAARDITSEALAATAGRIRGAIGRVDEELVRSAPWGDGSQDRQLARHAVGGGLRVGDAAASVAGGVRPWRLRLPHQRRAGRRGRRRRPRAGLHGGGQHQRLPAPALRRSTYAGLLGAA